MKVFVTGASGFLGGALARQLSQTGHEVHILARKTSQLQHLEHLPIAIHFCPLEDLTCHNSLLEDIDIIYHCAALSSDWGDWQDFYQANVVGVQNLLEIALKANQLRRFVHVSSTDVYGYPRQACDERYPITDVGLPYNRSKGLGEKLVWEYHHKHGLPVTILRPATIYGPRSTSIVVEWAHSLIQKEALWVDQGKIRAGLLYIDNAVEAIIQASLSPLTIGQAYNLRDETDENWRQFGTSLTTGLEIQQPGLNLPSQLVYLIAAASEFGARTLKKKGRPLVTRHSLLVLCRDQGYPIDKARRDFGFCSRVSYSEGMRRTVEWLKSEEGQAALLRRKGI